ncbi:MAG: subtype B tannase [Cardiobacteriaceae bacterium]|nr:subtype B tannase [Cardiobacteriaceae bacterium]
MKKTLLTAAIRGSTIHFAHADALTFNPDAYRQAETDGQAYRAYEGIVYVAHPVDAQHQQLNLYIPEAYFHDGSIDGFTANNAPIFLPNNIGGYMPAEAGTPDSPSRNGQKNTIAAALSKGYVVASPAARGRTSPTGKAPAAILDLKAAVRYLRFNDARMPGDAEKIISNGTSAGGALSVLLGATASQADYEPYLLALGAAPARDDIFAVSSYCPISDLEHADAAYEWQFQGVNDYEKMDISMLDYKVERKLVKGSLNAEQQRLSSLLKPTFTTYLNSLNLQDTDGTALTLDKDGNGSFKNYLATQLVHSAQSALDNKQIDGKDLQTRDWLTIENNRVTAADFDRYAHAAGRQKNPPAFDAIDLSSGENQLFGTAENDKQHFTDFSMQHNTVPQATRADTHIVKLMNPLPYLDTTPVKHWRIRVGTVDRDTSLAISAILAISLQQRGKSVDYALPWNVPHRGDYDLDALFAWMKRISLEK